MTRLPLLQVAALRKTFGGVVATDDVFLNVMKGELHAIIGPNGAGKTTLVSQLSGTLAPDAGAITLNGMDIINTPAYKRARLGITRSFQITSLVMEMSVLDNIALAVQARKGSSFRFIKPARTITEIRDEAMTYVCKLGLRKRADDPASALSHGEHRQMEIAIALASEAELMLLDEPMAGLGPEESRLLTDFLLKLKGSRSILLIEHDMDAVFALADRISVLVYGQVIATGTPDEIRNDATVRRAYLGDE